MHKSRSEALIVDRQSEILFQDAQFWAALLGLKKESNGGLINQRYVRLEGKADEPQVIF